jgi:hypothetical protein
MKNERNKFLTEAMGLCYHDYVEVHGTDSWDERSACDTLDFKCSKCEDYQEHVKYRDHSGHAVKRENYYDFSSYCFVNFSRWSGFGLLWDWCNTGDFPLGTFIKTKTTIDNDNMHLPCYLVNPDKLADAVYTFLKENQK